MLRRLIYSLKRRIHDQPALYQALFNLLTLNRDYLGQRLQASQYPSRFGGMWTDRKDFAKNLSAKRATGAIDAALAQRLQHWSDHGFVTLPQALSESLIDAYQTQIAELKGQQASPLMVTAESLPRPVPFTLDIEERERSVRTVDDYFFCDASRQLLMHQSIMDFIGTVFAARPLLNQSLSFEHGSQQAVHQDTGFVRMNSPMKLAAVWIALEDVEPGSGELVYYPGSHRWEGFLFSGRFKHWDEERDGLEQLEQWHQWIHEEAKARGCNLESFLPKKGDVFIWHAALAHGGAKATDPTATRRSLVGHFCPDNVRPLYHYYKPGQRRSYSFDDYRYCSSYYRR